MTITFTTTLLQAEGLNATGISVPPEIIAELGKQKRPKVKVSLNGYTYRSTVALYGDVFMLPVSQEHRAATGLKAGDTIEVTLELDLEPRTVEIPDDLKAALSEKAGMLETFEKLSDSKRKEFVRQVNDAKTPETRTRRIARIVAKMSEA
ncbi:MAG: YdeI/OmpD-associated family protein [Chloroflexota bacterium]